MTWEEIVMDNREYIGFEKGRNQGIEEGKTLGIEEGITLGRIKEARERLDNTLKLYIRKNYSDEEILERLNEIFPEFELTISYIKEMRNPNSN